jgi:hypothetical protein
VEILRSLARVEFATGLLLGTAALLVGLILAGRRAGMRPRVATGLLFSAAFVLTLEQVAGLPWRLGLGLAGLAGAGAASGRGRIGRLSPVLAAPGAMLVVSASSLPPGPWTLASGATVIVLGAWLLSDLDFRWRDRGLGPVLLAVSLAGVFSTVPDTEQALAAFGVSLPLALLSWPWPLAWIGRAGAYAAAGSLVWVVATGGVGRGSAVVGGAACLGLFVVEPVARRLDRSGRSVLASLPGGRWGTVLIASLHLALVYVAARVAGTRSTPSQATAIVVAEFACAVALAVVLQSTRRVGHRS